MLLVLLALVGVSAARADWQGIPWGSSPNQVKAATNLIIRETSPKERSDNRINSVGDALLIAAYRASGMAMPAFFLFSGDRLTGVVLSPSGIEDGFKTLNILKSQYGQPVQAKQTKRSGCDADSFEWSDKAGGNYVRFSSFVCYPLNPGPTLFSVTYTPIPSAASSGF